MEIRNYISDDREQVAVLWNETFPNSTGHNEPYSAIDRKFDVDDGLFFVAGADATIVGTVLAATTAIAAGFILSRFTTTTVAKALDLRWFDMPNLR